MGGRLRAAKGARWWHLVGACSAWQPLQNLKLTGQNSGRPQCLAGPHIAPGHNFSSCNDFGLAIFNGVLSIPYKQIQLFESLPQQPPPPEGFTTMFAATRSSVAYSIHTEVPPNHPHYEEIRRTVDYFELLMSAKHPFIKEGPRSPFFSRIEGDKVYRRVDMPGVGKEGLKIWAEENGIVIQGVESNTDEGVQKRVYIDKLGINPASVINGSFNFLIQNGVVYIVLRLRSPI